MNRMRWPLSLLVTLLLGALGPFQAAAQALDSEWVYPSPTGNLLYKLDERGQRITDFSHCGYRGGTVPLPASGANDGALTKVDFTTQRNTPSPGVTTVTATVTGAAASKLFVRVNVSQP